MISKYKIRAIVLMVAGIALQLLGIVALFIGTEFLFWSYFFLVFAGWVSFLVGCMYYAEIKGYHGAIGLLLGLFFYIPGLLILIFLPKRPEKIEEEKISRFVPKGKKEKILLILMVAVLLVILIVVGKQVAGLKGVGKEYEEAKKSIEEFMAEQRSPYQKIISNMEKIQDVFLKIETEVVYDSTVYTKPGDYTNVNCSDPRIKTFCDEIESQIGTKPIIHTTEDKYCAYTKLPTSGKYSCINTYTLLIPATIDADPSNPGYCDGVTFNCYKEKEEKTDTGINISSPAGGESWKEGETRSITWEQWGLTGKKIKICLIGNNSTSQPLYQKDCSNVAGYQIGEAVFAESGKYDWEIPNNLSDKFLGTPVSYYIKIQPVENIFQLGLSIKYGITDDFEISK